MDETLLTVEELAAYLQVPVATIYAWNSRNGGPKRIKLGRHVRYRRVDIEAWLDTRAVDNAPPWLRVARNRA